MSVLRIALRFMLACWAVPGWGQLPDNTPIPGGIAKVVLGPVDMPKPTVHFGRHAVMVVENKGMWISVVGLGLDIVPGRYILKSTDNEQVADAHEFTVRAHRYRVTQPAPIAKKARGKRPVPVVITDITYDPLMHTLPLQLWDDTPKLPLRVPADGARVNDRFGEREVDQHSSSRPIRFLEFALAGGHTVRAPGAGRVIGVLPLALGNAVAMDHGMGLWSLLWPVSAVAVAVNEDVASGATLGVSTVQPESGAARLRWSVAMNAEFINPRLLIDSALVRIPRQTVSR